MKAIVFTFAAFFAASSACACDCSSKEPLPIFASEEDPLVEPGYGVHSIITNIHQNADDCVMISKFQPGETETFTTEHGTFLRFRVVDSIRDMTLDELYTHATTICSRTATEAALN